MNKIAGDSTPESKNVPTRSEFIAWWARTEPDLLRIARSLGLRDAAQDVVQDVAVLALMRYQRFSDVAEFGKWARARTRWFSLDQLTKSKSEVDLDAILATAGVMAMQEPNATAAELRKLIEKLPARQRETVERSLRGQSPSEIGNDLGIDPSTVRSLLRFARRTLFRRMQEGGINE
jgi:RNA polymerase sigma factor (sigma-70 family)